MLISNSFNSTGFKARCVKLSKRRLSSEYAAMVNYNNLLLGWDNNSEDMLIKLLSNNNIDIVVTFLNLLEYSTEDIKLFVLYKVDQILKQR